MLLVKTPRRKLSLQPPTKYAELTTSDKRRHRHGQRRILRNLRQKFRLGIQIWHQLAAVPHQEKVNVIAVIVDRIQQPQQAALHAPKLHGLGEDENGWFHRAFLLIYPVSTHPAGVHSTVSSLRGDSLM